MMSGAEGMGWWGFGGGVMMLLWWGVIIFLVIAVVRWLLSLSGDRMSGGGAEKRALDILGDRFARGEIDSEEYEEMKRNIES